MNNTNTNSIKPTASKVNPSANHTDRNTDKNSSDLAGWEEKVMTAITNLGDMIERAGEKTEGKGFEKIGQAIYQLGDKIEHLGAGPRRFANKNDSKESSSMKKSDDSSQMKYNS